jgi:ABC-2 type transport system ATP-binding protein
VSAGYGQRTVLRALDLTVGVGEIFALLGANGAGKSTTLALFLGFLRPSQGEVCVDGVSVLADPVLARSKIAYIPENVALYDQLSARENLAYFLSLAHQAKSAGAIEQALSAAGLPETDHGRRLAGFSKGMRQKVAIALALAREVPALLLDEPCSGLDPQATAEFNRLLLELRSRGLAVLLVSHDLLAAAQVADRIGFMQSGRLVNTVAAQGSERFDVRSLHGQYARQQGLS